MLHSHNCKKKTKITLTHLFFVKVIFCFMDFVQRDVCVGDFRFRDKSQKILCVKNIFLKEIFSSTYNISLF